MTSTTRSGAPFDEITLSGDPRTRRRHKDDIGLDRVEMAKKHVEWRKERLARRVVSGMVVEQAVDRANGALVI
jgi:hypothetical protein